MVSLLSSQDGCRNFFAALAREQEKQRTDLEIRIGNTSFHVHKLVISAHAPALGKLVGAVNVSNANTQPSQTARKTMQLSTSPGAFGMLVDWMYGRTLPEKSEHWPALLGLTLLYNVFALELQCCDVLKRTLDDGSCLSVLRTTTNITSTPSVALHAHAVEYFTSRAPNSLALVDSCLRDMSDSQKLLKLALAALIVHTQDREKAGAVASSASVISSLVSILRTNLCEPTIVDDVCTVLCNTAAHSAELQVKLPASSLIPLLLTCVPVSTKLACDAIAAICGFNFSAQTIACKSRAIPTLFNFLLTELVHIENPTSGINAPTAPTTNTPATLTKIESCVRCIGYLCTDFPPARLHAQPFLPSFAHLLAHIPAPADNNTATTEATNATSTASHASLARVWLASLADVTSNNPASQSACCEAGVISQIKSVVHMHSHEASCLTAACRAISALCQGHVATQVQARVEGLVSSIVGAMVEFESNALFQRHACAALRNLAFENTQLQTEIIHADGLSRITSALLRHRDDAAVVKTAAAAARNLLCSLPDSENLPDLVVELLAGGRAHLGDAECQARVCGALFFLSTYVDLHACFERGDIFEFLKSVLTAHSHHAPTVKNAFGIVYNLAGGWEHIQVAIRETGLLSIVCQITREHAISVSKPDFAHASVQEYACKVFGKLCDASAEHRQDILAAGMLPTICKVMDIYIDNAVVQTSACSAISLMVRDNSEAQAGARDAGAFPSIQRALRNQINSADLVARACEAVFSLSTNQPVTHRLIKELGLLPLIVRAMEIHPHELAVQLNGCGVLQNICCTRDNCDLVAKCGGVRAVIAAVSEYGTEEGGMYVVAWGLSALHGMCARSVECRTAAVDDGALAVLLGVENLFNDVSDIAESARAATRALKGEETLPDADSTDEPADTRTMESVVEDVQRVLLAMDKPAPIVVPPTGHIACVGCDASGPCQFVLLPCVHFVCSTCSSQSTCTVCDKPVSERVVCMVSAGDRGSGFSKRASLAASRSQSSVGLRRIPRQSVDLHHQRASITDINEA